MSIRHVHRSAILVGALLICVTGQLAAAEAPVPADVTGALEWRQLGPFRGGWATMATGVPSQTRHVLYRHRRRRRVEDR